MTTAIELRHLRHFIALAQELHFGRAAQRCHISQPPFSVSIRQLEQALGFALVERSTHEVRLTAAGAAYYEEALKVVSQFERAHATAARVHQGMQGTLEVGFFASMLHRGLDRAVQVFGQSHPDVDLRLVELSTADQIPALQRHRIRYGFVHSTALPATVMSEELLCEPFVLCLPAAHPMARAAPKTGRRRAQAVDLARFKDEPFVLFSRTFSPAYYDHVVSLCLSAGFHPRVRHEARHWLTVLACVSKGLGITLVPRSLVRSRYPDLCFADLQASPVASIVRGAWLASEADDPALRAWHAVVRRHITA